MSKHPDVFTVHLAEGQGEAFPSASFETPRVPVPNTEDAAAFQRDYAAARDRAARAKALRELATELAVDAKPHGLVEISIDWLERRAKSVETEPLDGPTRIDRLEWIANQLAWAVLDNVPGKPGYDAVQAIFLEADRRFPPRTK